MSREINPYDDDSYTIWVCRDCGSDFKEEPPHDSDAGVRPCPDCGQDALREWNSDDYQKAYKENEKGDR